MAALFRFLSAGGDKGYPYFQCSNAWRRTTVSHGSTSVRMRSSSWRSTWPAHLSYVSPYQVPPSPLFCNYRSGNQLGHRVGARLGSKAYLLCEQGATRAGGTISSHRKGSLGSVIFSSATRPLFPEFHCDSNDWSPNPQSPPEDSRSDGALGSRVVWVWRTVGTQGAYQGPGIC